MLSPRKKEEPRTRRLVIYVTQAEYQILTQMTKESEFPSKSDFIREAINVFVRERF